MRAAAFVLALLAALPASAGAQEVGAIAIVEHGIYIAEVKATTRLPSGVEHDDLANICHVSTTTTVPAISGLHFGMRFRIDGPLAGQRVELRKVVVYPAAMTPPGAARPITTFEAVEVPPLEP